MRERRILRRIVSPTALESLSTRLHPVLRRVYAARGSSTTTTWIWGSPICCP